MKEELEAKIAAAEQTAEQMKSEAAKLSKQLVSDRHSQ